MASDFARRCPLSPEPNAQAERIETPPPVLTLVDAPSAPGMDPAPAEPRCGLARRVLFRFAFACLLLYNLPFPLSHVPYLDDPVYSVYAAVWDFLVPAVG